MKSKVIIIILGAALLAASASAGGLSSARCVGMGEANMGLAKGVIAPLYNPANLSLSGYSESGIEIVGIGAEVSNNSFSLDDYNKYTGAILTTEDKDYLLSLIPEDGWELNARVNASALSISFGSFVITTEGYAASNLDLDKDVFNILMNGNAIGDTISLDGTYGDAVSYGSAGLSFGKTLYKSGTRQLAIGTTVKYVRGVGITEILELSGDASTLITGFEGSGTVRARTATGGNGYALDLGAALKLSDDYTVGAAISNVMSSITWNHETEEHYFHYEFDTTTVDNMEDDSVVVTDDYTEAIGSFETSLPSVLRVGIANISGKFKWALDWEQGFEISAGTSTSPRIMGGIEWRLIGFLPLRAGYGIGGGRGSTVSFGSGLDLGFYYLDAAVTNHGTITSGSSKGLHLAVSTGLKF